MGGGEEGFFGRFCPAHFCPINKRNRYLITTRHNYLFVQIVFSYLMRVIIFNRVNLSCDHYQVTNQLSRSLINKQQADRSFLLSGWFGQLLICYSWWFDNIYHTGDSCLLVTAGHVSWLVICHNQHLPQPVICHNWSLDKTNHTTQLATGWQLSSHRSWSRVVARYLSQPVTCHSWSAR